MKKMMNKFNWEIRKKRPKFKINRMVKIRSIAQLLILKMNKIKVS
jgi:hypothetical protein